MILMRLPPFGRRLSVERRSRRRIQRVDHESRAHLDIETDDVEAETSRLEGLGARRIAKVKTWWVMEAPTGQRFCVVRPQRADFEKNANVWQSQGDA